MIDPITYTVSQYPLQDKGGQHVGGGTNGVKIVHESGLVVCCHVARSQFRNRMIALDMLLAGLTHPNFDG